MSLFTVFLWTLVGLGFGILGFLALPIMLGPALPAQQAERLAAYYDRLAMKTAERLVNVRRQIGAYSPSPSSFDPSKEAEKVSLDGETHHFADEVGVLGTYHDRPFGFALEGLGVIIDPFIASMTDYERPREESGDWLRENDEGELESVPEVEIPEQKVMPELRNAAYMIPGERSSKDPELASSYYQIAEALFGRSRVVDVMLVAIIPYAVGGILMFIALQYGSGGGGAPSVPAFPSVIWP